MNKSVIVRRFLLSILLALGGLVPAMTGTSLAEDKAAAAVKTTSGYEIPELGAWIDASADGPRVVKIAPAAARGEKYQSVDMKVGDRIVSINGQRVATLDEVRKIIAGAKAGDEIRIGSLRTKGAALAVYTVADETERKALRETASAPCMVTVAGKANGEPQRQMMTLQMEEGSVPCMELAVVLMEKDGRITVSKVLPLPLPIPDNARLREGDVIRRIQDQKPASADEFVAKFTGCKEGDNVTLVVDRAGQETTLTFAKPGMPGKVIYKTK